MATFQRPTHLGIKSGYILFFFVFNEAYELLVENYNEEYTTTCTV